MPRPREFDTEELLGQILLIFLENGWQQTSTRLLESSTGVKQVSLYNAFGNKEALFLAAFDHWAQQAAAAQNQFMNGNGIDGIANFVKAIVREDSPLPMPQCGCLAVNTALVAQEAGPAIQDRVQTYRDEIAPTDSHRIGPGKEAARSEAGTEIGWVRRSGFKCDLGHFRNHPACRH